MDTLGNRIKKARSDKGISQEQLAIKIGVTKSAVSQWENNVIRKMEADNLLALADALNVNPYWLAGSRAHSFKSGNEIRERGDYTLHGKIHLLPDWQSIIDWLDTGSVPKNSKTIDKPAGCGDRTYALTVRSDIMAPIFPRRAYIIVDPDRPFRHGTLIVVHIAGWNEATFRKLIIDANQMYLEPLNKAYDPIKLSEHDYRYCGRVINMIMEFDIE